MCEYYKKKALEDGHGEIVSFITILADTLRKVLDDPPVYRELTVPLAPVVSVSDTGAIVYKEVAREGVKDMADYVRQLTTTLPAPRSLPFDVPVLVSQLANLGVSEEVLASLRATLTGGVDAPPKADIVPKVSASRIAQLEGALWSIPTSHRVLTPDLFFRPHSCFSGTLNGRKIARTTNSLHGSICECCNQSLRKACLSLGKLPW